ncbi:MAG: phosphatase PAP2 family protein [Planctomycetota bacterium]
MVENLKLPERLVRSPLDFICIGWYSLIFILCIANISEILNPWLPVVFFGVAAAVFLLLPLITNRLSYKGGLILRAGLLCIFIPITFDMVGRVVPDISPDPRESWLLYADQLVFGGDPTRWTGESEHFPWLTELLQIVYSSFYFLSFVLVARLLILKKIRAIEHTAFVVAAGFLISYFGYFLIPGRSPYHLYRYPFELHGIFVTDALRAAVLAAEERRFDVFPSGHCDVTWLVTACAYRYDRKSFYIFFLPVAILLPISTVYLRYHYGVDIIAGMIWAVATWVVCEKTWASFYNEPASAPAGRPMI